MESMARAYQPGFARSLLVGIPSIDREHEDHVAQLDLLARDTTAHPAGEVFSQVLERLGEQIRTHFDNEEVILKSIGLPADDLLQHLRAHDEILEEYTQLNFDLMNGKVFARATIIASIKGWIIDHVHQHDLKIRKYLPKD